MKTKFSGTAKPTHQCYKYGMTEKLRQLFDLPEQPTAVPQPLVEPVSAEPTDLETLARIDTAIDKIDAALPGVRGLEATDTEMDDLAKMATDAFQDLMEIGNNVEARFSSEIYAVASNMLGHAITAKTAKLDKKLKMVDLQLKKARLDQQNTDAPPPSAGSGVQLSRNELLAHILNSGGQKTNH